MSYNRKQIRPLLTKDVLKLTDAELQLMAVATNQVIGRGTAPLIGAYVRIGNQLVTEKIPPSGILEISYLWGEEGDNQNLLLRIGVGTKIHGPLLCWLPDSGWTNLYGDGDHGDNPTTGGGWSCGSRTATIANALHGRDYMVGGTFKERSALMEGPALLDALKGLSQQE